MHINVDPNFECILGNGLRMRRSSANQIEKVAARLVVALRSAADAECGGEASRGCPKRYFRRCDYILTICTLRTATPSMLAQPIQTAVCRTLSRTAVVQLQLSPAPEFSERLR